MARIRLTVTRLALAALTSCICVSGRDALLAEDAIRPEPAYCGIYCVHRALAAIGKDVSFASLVQSKYIGSPHGSSASELAEAVEDSGGHCYIVAHMSGRALRKTRFPTILHVKSTLDAPKYNHWVLYVGSNGNRAVIYDEMAEATTLEYSDLAARWDGLALIVTREPELHAWLYIDTAVPFVVIVGAVTCVALCWGAAVLRVSRSMSSKHSLVALISFQSTVLIVIALTLCALYALLNPTGYLSSKQAIASIQRAKLGTFLHSTSLTGVVESQQRSLSRAVIIDARNKADYQHGHIDGAVNIPPATKAAECQRRLHGVPRTARIIIYCQSSGCPYSRMTAQTLQDAGYTHLEVFPGGWHEWEQYHRRSK